MFNSCESLTSIDAGKIDTSSATDLQAMFAYCKGLQSIDVSGFDTSKVTNMQSMFDDCANLKNITFGDKFLTKKVTRMDQMFYRCSRLTELDLTSFDLSGKPSASSMFGDCTSLKTIYASDWASSIKADLQYDNMFDNCTSLAGGAGTKFSASHIGKEYARIDGGAAAPGYFSRLRKDVIFTAPSARTGLVENGSAQALITAGSAAGGTMQYALGDKSSAAGAYSTSIPTGTYAGTYYVWYKVVGDADHKDTEPAYITVTIDPAPETAPADPVEIQLNSNFRIRWKDRTVVAVWGLAAGADSYEVWAGYSNGAFQKVQTVQNTDKAVIKSLNGRKLKTSRIVKVYIVAKRGGTEIGRTIRAFAAGIKNRYTNVKKLNVLKKSCTLKGGNTEKIKTSVEKVRRKKHLLPGRLASRLRYRSSNPAVATVNGEGRIMAVGAGTCDIWVYAQNGRSQKVTVTVS